MPASMYNAPVYYDIAFSFRCFERETALIHELISLHSGCKVHRILEIACGHAPHLPGITAAGFDYTGLDASDAMLAYAREKARASGASPHFFQADLVDFRLTQTVDFAMVLLGSLYVTNTPELRSHFDAMAQALNPGGLYLLDWCIDFTPTVDIVDTWREERDGIIVDVQVTCLNENRAEQRYEEVVRLDVDDHGVRHTFETIALKRAIYPQEFLFFLEGRSDFEFAGWWNDWDLNQPIGQSPDVGRPIAAVRRI